MNWRGRGGGSSSSREGVGAADFELGGGGAVEGGETTLGRLLGLGKDNIFLIKDFQVSHIKIQKVRAPRPILKP